MRACNAIIRAIVLCGDWSLAGQSQASVRQQDARVRGTAPADAETVRAEIRSLEAVISKVPDRVAILSCWRENMPT